MCFFPTLPPPPTTNIKHARFKGEYKEFLLSRIFLCHLRLNWNLRHNFESFEKASRARKQVHEYSISSYNTCGKNGKWKRFRSSFLHQNKFATKRMAAMMIISSNDVFLIDKKKVWSAAQWTQKVHVNSNNLIDAIITPGWFWSSEHLSILLFSFKTPTRLFSSIFVAVFFSLIHCQ